MVLTFDELVTLSRRKAGLTQKQLGKKLGYKSGQFISNVERGVCPFPVARYKDLAELLEIDIGKLKKAAMKSHEVKMQRYL